MIFSSKFFVSFSLVLLTTCLHSSNVLGKDFLEKDVIENIIEMYVDSILPYQKISYDLNVVSTTKVDEKIAFQAETKESGNLDMVEKSFFEKKTSAFKDKNSTDETKTSECIQKYNFFLYATIDETKQVVSAESRLGYDSAWIDELRFQYVSFLLGYLMLGEKNIYIPNLMNEGKISIEKITDKDNEFLLSALTEFEELQIRYENGMNFLVHELTLKNLQKNLKPANVKQVTLRIIERFPDGSPKKYHCEQIISGGLVSPDLEVPSKIAIRDVTFDRLEKKKTFISNDFSLSVPIKNGTPITMRDVPQIQYVWLDGKPVVKTDEVALRIARGDHGFMPGPKNPRFWFMALGVVLLLVGGGLKIRSMLKEG